MNGAKITLTRIKPLGAGVRQVFTTRGTITDGRCDDQGRATAVRIRGVQVESGDTVDSWYAVGPDALNGSLCTEQTATLDLCGHAVTYGCDCDTIAAEADDQDDDVCDCTPGLSLGCESEGCVILDEPRIISPYGCDTLGFSLN